MMPVSASDDYTDGHGWSKLDQTACNELAEIIAGLKRCKFEEHCRILLTLYRLSGRNGTISSKNGYRTISKCAGVTEDAARYFVGILENDGILIRQKNGSRQFFWMAKSGENTPEGSGENTPEGVVHSNGLVPEGSGAVQASSTTHKTDEDSQDRLSSTASGDNAASPDGGPHITEEEMAEINAKYERYMARARELGYGDAG